MTNVLTMELETAPEREDALVIGRGLTGFNAAHWGEQSFDTFALYLRDAEGTIRGGLYGQTELGWLYVKLLWIPEDLRGQGRGRELLTAAEVHAVSVGCRQAWLDTFDFQAPAFYEHMGYERFGELLDYPPGTARIFYRKALV